MSDTHWDYVLVGGGLQNGLIALAVLDRDPNARLLLIERGDELGGDHTWSFHEGYLPEAALGWLRPLVEHRWPRYRVTFPKLTRTLEHPYCTTSSAHFHTTVAGRISEAPRARLLRGVGATEVHADRAVLVDGATVTADLVVDARGPDTAVVPEQTGWQKFVGLEVELADAIDQETAELMDATVQQRDGFRFVYVLPFGPRRALIEDTYFSDTPDLDVPRLRDGVLAYCRQRGLRVTHVAREEHGVLPMPWRPSGGVRRQAPLVAGFQGGWFHPATGYSVPVATRLAMHVAERGPRDVFGADYQALADDQERQRHFAQLLNELLFTATKSGQRYRVFEHFYGLPEDLILRFYGLAMSRADRARFFLRRPPKGVKLAKAMKILPGWTMPWRRRA